MPTLFEKPAHVSSPALPARVLRSRHRWERWRGVLLTLLAGLAATLAVLGIVHLAWATWESWKIAAVVWGGGLLLTVAAAFVAWRFAPASLTDTAQLMDRNLAAKNRLEAAAAWHDSTSSLAVAQREETTAYLKDEPRARPVRALPWLAAAVAVMAMVHLVILAAWLLPSPSHSAASTPPPSVTAHFVKLATWMLPPLPRPAAPPPPPKQELPRATIIWKSPEPETKANPIEEVPTVAVAHSTSGLQDLSLEISVNGEPKKSVPLPAKPFDQAGANTVKVSVYMDELEVEPFDVVTYFIRGRRITDRKVPDTASAIQFIQVRPFRDDVTEVGGGTSHHKKEYGLLIRLKLAQLKAMKENFILAHTDLAVTDPAWRQENDRVGKNQGELSAKTEEVVQACIVAGDSPAIVDLLRQAEPLMDDASKKILATQNSLALPPQGKALSLIIAVEKFVIKLMARDGYSPSSEDPDDPFKDKQLHQLKKRFEMAAGQIDQLLKNQTKLANDLSPGDASGNQTPSENPVPAADSPPGQNPAPGAPVPGTSPNDAAQVIPLPPGQAVDPFGPDSGKGTLAERQARVLQGIEVLLDTNKVLPDGVIAALQDAQKHANGSVAQLDQGNNADAREPATATVQDLQQAIAAMEAAGQEQTRLAMEQAQQQLNDMARKLRDLAKEPPTAPQQQALADLASKAQDIQRKLEEAADLQQEAGSAEGAQRLNRLANQITTQNIGKDLDAMSKTGLDANKAEAVAQRLEALAGQAAQGMAPAKLSSQDVSRLVNSLERNRATLAHLAEMAANPSQTPGIKPGQSPDQGKGQSPTPGAQPGQNPGPGQTPGTQPGQGTSPSSNPNPSNANPSSETTTSPGESGSNSGSGGSKAAAYREALANVRNTAQQISSMVPGVDTRDVERRLTEIAATPYGEASPENVVKAYQALAAPLDKLIADLSLVADRAQREDVVKQPEPDEAPPAYRDAVFDYFEKMSRDYHPDTGEQDTKKP
jgi:hypothetical protein